LALMSPHVVECHAAPAVDVTPALAERTCAPTVIPRLLVSVRNSAEAAAALQGGAELLDIKAPERGSLGRPDPHTIRDVLAVRDALAPAIPISIALGELREWRDGVESVADWLPRGIRYAKVGLADCRGRDWIAPCAALQAAAPSHVEWVAVAYADARAALAPDVTEVLAGAARSPFAGVLVDTYSKRQGRLLDHLTVEALGRCARQVHSARLFWGTAGRLRLADLPRLAPAPVDVVAVRSAVCGGEDRQSTVEAERVAQFRIALRQAWSGSVPR
jgi:uncharacterized protein (UPF0264 family)